jgi:hypothetical protein
MAESIPDRHSGAVGQLSEDERADSQPGVMPRGGHEAARRQTVDLLQDVMVLRVSRSTSSSARRAV